MRVHGDKVIRRRSGLEKRADYKAYLTELREDFQHMCGYCGKTEAITKNKFEIDHFVPKKYAEDRVNDYTNLVYACWVCNRKKAAKWPSEDPNISTVDGKGFIDPADEKFDLHMERSEDGMICGKTEIGRYMAKEACQFQMRPMREMWQLMQLFEKKKKLRERMKTIQDPEKMREYIKIDEMLEKLEQYLFEKKRIKTKNISHPGAPDRKSRDAGIFLRIFIRKPPNYQLE